jgi:hypothetical protein
MDADELTVLERYPTEVEAKRMAGALVERGIGAVVQPEAGGAGFAVSVLPDDLSRGRQVLGLAEPEPDLDVEDNQLRDSSRAVLIPVLLVVGALIFVPLIAFLVSFKLSGG